MLALNNGFCNEELGVKVHILTVNSCTPGRRIVILGCFHKDNFQL